MIKIVCKEKKMQINNTREALLKSLQNKINISNRNVLIFGAGNASLLYEDSFKNESIDIKAFVDSDPNKKGKDFLGKKVISINEINTYDDPIVLISVTHIAARKEIQRLLTEKKCECYMIDEYVFTKNMDKVISVFDMLDDDKSKETYANMILARMDKACVNEDLVFPNSYFTMREFSILNYKEVYVDCGAFCGDSIEDYIRVREGYFDKIYAFEPDIRNFNAMKYRVDRLSKEWALEEGRITIVNAGVGEKTSKKLLNDQSYNPLSLGTSLSHESSGENGVDVYALDDYFSDFNVKISLIKADIESYEEKMIKGAEKIIKRDKPLMAICVYHNASDMYRIPLLLKKFNIEYKFSLRHYDYELGQIVLYAY